MTFTDVHTSHQKVPKSDFQSQFSMSKIIRIFLIIFSLKNISLEEGFVLLSYIKNFNFWTTLFFKMVPNFWRSVWTSVKVKSKDYFYSTDFFTKIYSLLTDVCKTPPLRSHYTWNQENKENFVKIFVDSGIVKTCDELDLCDVYLRLRKIGNFLWEQHQLLVLRRRLLNSKP